MISLLRFNRSTFPAGTASAFLTREPLPLAQFAPDISTEERIVLKTLRKNPDDRYQTAKDLLIDLRNLHDDLQFQNRLERSMGDRVKVTTTRSLAFT